MSSPTPTPNPVADATVRRGSMLEYQQRLTMLSSINQGVSNIREAFVAVRLGKQNWLVELSEVQEALAPPRMARIASSPSWVAGVVGVRGQVWSVIDMLALSPDQNANTNAQSRGWMTLLRDPPENPGSRLALLWSDMVEVATKQDYRKLAPLDDLDSSVSPSDETKDNSSQLASQDQALTDLMVFEETGQLPPWTRAIWQDRNGQTWRELDTAQILGPQGLVVSWRQRVDIPAVETSRG